jgi:hypothetical protein
MPQAPTLCGEQTQTGEKRGNFRVDTVSYIPRSATGISLTYVNIRIMFAHPSPQNIVWSLLDTRITLVQHCQRESAVRARDAAVRRLGYGFSSDRLQCSFLEDH